MRGTEVRVGRWGKPGTLCERSVMYRGKTIGKIIRISEPQNNSGQGIYYKAVEYEVVFYPPRLDKSFEISTADYAGDGRKAWLELERKLKRMFA